MKAPIQPLNDSDGKRRAARLTGGVGAAPPPPPDGAGE
jgi:hypothetical protein